MTTLSQQLKKSRKQIDRYMADNERLSKLSDEWLRREKQYGKSNTTKKRGSSHRTNKGA